MAVNHDRAASVVSNSGTKAIHANNGCPKLGKLRKSNTPERRAGISE
jgi:hypothetical protein